MQIFPTQYSTLSAIALEEYIEKVYGFEKLSCRLLIRNVSDVYILENNSSKYIFKIYRDGHRKLNEIEAEVELLIILKNKDAPVAYPIKDLSGNYTQQFNAAEGIRNGVLFSFAKGKVFINPDEEQLRIIGRSIAAIHNVSAVCELQHERIKYDIETTLLRPLEIIKHGFAELPEEYIFLRKLADQVIDKLEHLNTGAFSYGYCHYDLLPKNFHFDEDNNITFFDFDWSGKGFLVNDLMTFYVQFFFLIHFKMITREEADRSFGIFIEEYRKQRSVSQEELEAIPYLGLMFFIYGFGFYEDNFDDFSNTFLTTRFIKERVELIKKWSDWYCRF